jgi:hypothetical protein
MMDMVLALGGLKEEAVIPLSKVSEEIANLKKELEPLAAEILAFPDAYFEQFLSKRLFPFMKQKVIVVFLLL